MSIESVGEKPASVQRAAASLWLSAGLALVLTLMQIAGVVQVPDVGLTTVVGFVTVGLLALIAAKISAGRSWARWLFVAIYILGSFASAAVALLMPELFRAQPTILQGSTMVQFLLQTAAMGFMLTRTSRQWFKAQRVTTAP